MNVQPIERNNVTYFLFFDKENLELQIEKPEGIEKADWEIKQNQDGFGRYLTFADEINVVFIPRKDHQFAKLCQLYRANKWQNSAYLLIKIGGVEIVRARLKFEEVQTDYTYHFTIKIDINNQREIIEAKKSTSVNLISDKSVDNKDITPIQLTDVLTRFKEFFIDSRIMMNETEYPYYLDLAGDYGNERVWINFFNEAVNIGPEISVAPEIKTQVLAMNSANFTKFKSTADGTKLTVRITGLNMNVTAAHPSGIPKILFRVRITYNGDGSVNNIDETTIQQDLNAPVDFILPDTYEDNLVLEKDEEVFYGLAFTMSGRQGVTGGINFVTRPNIQFWSINVYEDTITKSARLIDIGKQCLKSITNDGVTVNAPRFTNIGGNFYDMYGTSGLFLRQFNDQPFYATWNNFAEFVRDAFNCDYQINGTEVFIGHQTDFYQDIELERFEFSPNRDSFIVQPFEAVVKSEFLLGYDKYEDDKASSNTIDSIHVKSEWYLPDSQPLESGQDEYSAKYVADQYMIENVRRESFNKDSTKTIPNDKEIYVIDTITEAGVLQNRSDQGFDVEELYSPETCYNLRLSVKRLIMDYFAEHLANISQFTQNLIAWKNTSYLNNPKAKITPTSPLTVITKDIETVEGADIVPEDLPAPFLDGDVYSFDLAYRVKFDKFWELADKILNQRGYVTFFTKTGTEVKIYISSLKYSWENEKIYNIKGERKYE